MPNLTSSLLRCSSLFAVLTALLLLSACPPNWNGLTPPDGGTLEPSVEPDDGGNPNEPEDAGPNEPDGGPDDAGPNEPEDAGPNEPDGGPDDAGPNEPEDAGPNEPEDAGPNEPDGGPNEPGDAGPNEPEDAGANEPDPSPEAPCVDFGPPDTSGWGCLTGAGVGAGECAANVDPSPVVGLVQRCPDVLALHASGKIAWTNIDHPTFTFVDDFGTCSNAPAFFTQFDVLGETVLGLSSTRACFKTLSVADCVCVDSGGGFDNAFSAGKVAGPMRVVLGRQDGRLVEQSTASVFDLAQGDAVEHIAVSPTPDGYLVAAYREDGVVSCVEKRLGENFPRAANGCALPSSSPIVAFSHEQPREGGRRVHLVSSNGGALSLSEAKMERDGTDGLQSTTRVLDRFPTPTAFAAKFDIGDGYRAAFGGPGGLVATTVGTQQDFRVPDSFPVDAEQRAAIRVLTYGLDLEGFPTSALYAISDDGIWTVDTRDLTQRPTFHPDPELNRPEVAEVVRIQGQQTLVVGEQDGTIRTYAVDGQSAQPLNVFGQIEADGVANSRINIPQAIFSVSNATRTRLVVLTTTNQLWTVRYDTAGSATTNNQFGLDETNDFAATLGLASGNFVISARADRRPADGIRGRAFITGRNGNGQWAVLLLTAFLETQSGALNQTLGLEERVAVPNAGAQPVPFRFSVTTIDDEHHLTWTTADGSAVTVPHNGTDFLAERTSRSDTSSEPGGGARALNFDADCALVFAADSPFVYAHAVEVAVDLGVQDAVIEPVPLGLTPTAMRRIGNRQSILGGAHGELVVLDTDDTCATPGPTSLRSLVARPVARVTALEWVAPDTLLMGSADGTVRMIPIAVP